MHSNWDILGNLLLAAFLGAVGQLLRIVAGLKKASDSASANGQTLRNNFDGKRLLVSLGVSIAIGALAGLLAAFQAKTPWDKAVLLSLVGAGYSGSDFIEAFMKRASGSGSTGNPSVLGTNAMPAPPPTDQRSREDIPS